MKEMQERNLEKQKIFDRVRGAKPNFTLGADKPSYQTEGSANLVIPKGVTYSNSNSVLEQSAIQRAHNFKMSYDGIDKGLNSASAIRLTAQQVNQAHVNIPKGLSNQHSLNIKMNNKVIYESQTAK